EYVKEYYVKDIGLVKKLQHRISPESTADNTVYIDLTSQLSAIGENTGYADTGYFFYPILGTGEIDYFTSEIQHHTNEDAAAALETLLKSYPELPDGTFIGKDTKINSVELDYNEGKIKADFSKSLETALSQDPAAEELYLQALINTVGYYFDTSRVLITVEGAGYHGGVELSADEYRDVVATIHADNTLQESE
ncbi:MAG: GerMN domain-containing protein, partial [Clostridiales bacterium]|nr:GerMN domain-containing protein [Clostridiales bacterium]